MPPRRGRHILATGAPNFIQGGNGALAQKTPLLLGQCILFAPKRKGGAAQIGFRIFRPKVPFFLQFMGLEQTNTKSETRSIFDNYEWSSESGGHTPK